MGYGIKSKTKNQLNWWKNWENKVVQNNNGTKKEVNVYFLNHWLEAQLITYLSSLSVWMILKLRENQRKGMSILKLCQISQWVKRRNKAMIRRMFLKKLDKLKAGSVKLIETQIKYFSNQEDYEIMIIRAIVITFFDFYRLGFQSVLTRIYFSKIYRF